jgi:hypothetical protein
MRMLHILLRRRRSRRTAVPADPELLHRIYCDTHRRVEDLRRAA